jgi:hypothetical protein
MHNHLDRKYYHGTSSMFLQSILNNGLGGIHPTIRFRLLDLLSYLFEECERYLIGMPDYENLRFTTSAMVNQVCDVNFKVDGIENFYYNHQYIHLALDKSVAVEYSSNEFGSELLTRVMTLHKLLRNSKYTTKIPAELNLFGIENISSSSLYPMVIECSSVDPEILEKEDGQTAIEALNFLIRERSTMGELMYNRLLRFANFRLLKPVPVKDLSIYRVIFKGMPNRNVNWSYNLESLYS